MKSWYKCKEIWNLRIISFFCPKPIIIYVVTSYQNTSIFIYNMWILVFHNKLAKWVWFCFFFVVSFVHKSICICVIQVVLVAFQYMIGPTVFFCPRVPLGLLANPSFHDFTTTSWSASRIPGGQRRLSNMNLVVEEFKKSGSWKRWLLVALVVNVGCDGSGKILSGVVVFTQTK